MAETAMLRQRSHWTIVCRIAIALCLIGCDRSSPPAKTSAAIVVSGDTTGWIVPCGCTANQSGGLLRRGAFLRRLRTEADVLYTDAGGAPAGTSPYQS